MRLGVGSSESGTSPLWWEQDGDTHFNAIHAINTAYARSVDAVQGFRTMVAKAEVEFKPVAERFLSLHKRSAAAFANLLTSAGQSPDTSGSFMRELNELVVLARAMLEQIDKGVMDQIRGTEASDRRYSSFP